MCHGVTLGATRCDQGSAPGWTLNQPRIQSTRQGLQTHPGLHLWAGAVLRTVNAALERGMGGFDVNFELLSRAGAPAELEVAAAAAWLLIAVSAPSWPPVRADMLNPGSAGEERPPLHPLGCGLQ